MTDGDPDDIVVGQCEECGYVFDDDVDFRFPQPAECSCGRTLTSTTVADVETLESVLPTTVNYA
ncbi:hypothetical protein D8Y22_05525 [Salinadaptatus halalkaliphilus]|uniref:Uncharacterized protein n=1 Tax=Salinadaptatus halalkaliphilus TaxID=2419781 RepID=A0A4S3TRA8_9EURY|nr:hypothetical protein D8Y22_05525 [Salinadaptatus halalkaliphilus]